MKPEIGDKVWVIDWRRGAFMPATYLGPKEEYMFGRIGILVHDPEFGDMETDTRLENLYESEEAAKKDYFKTMLKKRFPRR